MKIFFYEGSQVLIDVFCPYEYIFCFNIVMISSKEGDLSIRYWQLEWTGFLDQFALRSTMSDFYRVEFIFLCTNTTKVNNRL